MLKRVLHLGVLAFQSLRRSVWFFTRPSTIGVHGIPLTPEGNVVLVTLSYAKGWRLPGGGLKVGEDRSEAMLRELREEIGLTAHLDIEPVCDFEHRPDFRHGDATLFVVRGVEYRPRWSLEVRTVGEFALSDLPQDTASVTLRLLALAEPQLRQPIPALIPPPEPRTASCCLRPVMQNDLQRFVDAQENTYATVQRELARGRKTTHWMWFIFPQLRGLGSSEMAYTYGIASLDEARAYLAHPLLGSRLRECVMALQDLPQADAEKVFGNVDALKLRSSLTLFQRAGGGELFEAALKRWFSGKADERTDQFLGLVSIEDR